MDESTQSLVSSVVSFFCLSISRQHLEDLYDNVLSTLFSFVECQLMRSFSKKTIFCFTFLVANAVICLSLNAQLPDESVVPGEQASLATTNLPDESQLPVYVLSQDEPREEGPLPPPILLEEDNGINEPLGPPPPPVVPPADDNAPDDERKLPSEAELPSPKQNADPDQPTVEDDFPEPVLPPGNRVPLAQLDDSPDNRPWLKLRFRGPVAPLHAIAFSDDAQRLFAGGEDKLLWSWTLLTDARNSRHWRYERRLRWPIQRGERGVVTALASQGDLVAVAGYGAYGGNGDIFLFNAKTGQLQNVLFDDKVGHRQVISTLAFSPVSNQRALISADLRGKIVYWHIPDKNRGIWQGRLVRDTDRKKYGNEPINAIETWRSSAPVVFIDPRTVVTPEFVQLHKSGYPLWKLVKIDIGTRRQSDLIKKPSNYPWHGGSVVAMAATKDGSRLVSSDAGTRSYLWRLKPEVRVEQIGNSERSSTFAFNPKGDRLAVGVGPKFGINVYHVNDVKRPLAARTLPKFVAHLQFTPSGRQLAFLQERNIHIAQLDSRLSDAQIIDSGFRPVSRVAFSKKLPYRIAFGDEEKTSSVFDTRRVELTREAQIRDADWIPQDHNSLGWSVRSQVDSQKTETFWLYEGENRRARIPFRRQIEGEPSAVAWLAADGAKSPFAVAVAAGGRNRNIYIYRVANQGKCELMRQMRGHSGEITSMSVSHDLRYMLSSSKDGTIRIWTIEGLQTMSGSMNRWGATFAAQDGAVVVTEIRKDGPLYFRGVRAGDALRTVRFLDTATNSISAAANVNETVTRLNKADWDEMVQFFYQRGAAPPNGFVLHPAWQQVVSLFVDGEGEWAYWSPSGYYDASFEGHRRFGWQINRGRTDIPDFFLAGQFRAALERPAVMKLLTEAGNIDDAFDRTESNVPARPDQAILDQYRLKPLVKILPVGDVGSERSVTLQADITVPQGERLLHPKAFANGVIATDRKLISTRRQPDGTVYRYEWNAALPSSDRVLVQVVAGTSSKIFDIQHILIHRGMLPEVRSPKMYVASVGINRYGDAQIQQLQFAVNNAARFASTMKQHAQPLYSRTEAISLVNDNANRQSWDIAIESFTDQLRNDVSPDDLLVIFMSGHGIRDEHTGSYYYVGHDARYADLMSEQYADCLSFSDFSRFANIPCRKLVILDTCHAGAINADQTRELKSALRLLQDDMMFTLTASQGSEEAAELREKRLGRFTYRLIQALEGAADRTGNRDGVVSLGETIAFVKQSVRMDSASDFPKQIPTAGPTDLLEFADFNLTQAASNPASARRPGISNHRR